jgi:hypothetical protein
VATTTRRVMASCESAALTALSSVARRCDCPRPGSGSGGGAFAHPRHVDLLIQARDVLGDGALEEAVVLGDEGRGLVVAEQV